MTGVDLRPLSLGEILDRTFTLYRRHFLLFIGITAIPRVVMLAAGLLNIFLVQKSPASVRVGAPLSFGNGSFWWFYCVTILIGLLVYLLSQGGTTVAVSELYLGRTTTIGDSLRRVWGELGTLFGVVVLTSLVIFGGTLLLIIPGIYIACRLLVGVPASLIEGKGPSESISRSWQLTKGYAGRGFVLYVLFFVVTFGMGAITAIPILFLLTAVKDNPEAIRMWQAVSQVLTEVVNTLISPLLLIGTSVFYYDLRVRKEAFDLQFMMDPTSEHVTRKNDGLNLSHL